MTYYVFSGMLNPTQSIMSCFIKIQIGLTFLSVYLPHTNYGMVLATVKVIPVCL